MAGNGKRFKEAGYEQPKPLIDINGRPMIDWALSSLRPKSKHHLILIAKHEVYGLYKTDATWVSIGETTQGAACTVLMARELIDNNEPLLIGNCDQYLEGFSVDAFLAWAHGTGGDGAIVTFQSDGNPKWSYVRTDRGRVVEVKEKQVISDEATVGVYWYRRGKDFVKAADKMIRSADFFNGEAYIAPTMNYLKGPVYPYRIEQMWGLGTPEDLERFLAAHIQRSSAA